MHPFEAERKAKTYIKNDQRMIRDAEYLGADAIVNVRLTSSMVMQGASEILAYGTAVKLA